MGYEDDMNQYKEEKPCQRCNGTGMVCTKPFMPGEYGQNAPCPECKLGQEIQKAMEMQN